jgi:hypothetical protein
MADRVGGLHQHLDAGAAHALDHVGGRLDRHAGIEPDVARHQVRIEARLRHVAGDDRADIGGRGAGAREHCTRRLDTEIDRRDLRERAVIVGERRAHAVEQPDVAPCGGETHAQALSSMVMTRADGVLA